MPNKSSIADGCGSGQGRLCTPRAAATGVDGWRYAGDTGSVLFTGSALPPRGSTVEVQYQEKAP